MEFFWTNFFWIVLLMVFLAALIGLLVMPVRGREERTGEFRSGMPDRYAEEVAMLNDRYDRGEIDPVTYARERRRLDDF